MNRNCQTLTLIQQTVINLSPPMVNPIILGIDALDIVSFKLRLSKSWFLSSSFVTEEFIMEY